MGTVLEVMVEEDPTLAAEEVVEINLEEFLKAQRDERVHAFLSHAKEYGVSLERDGRNVR